MPSTVLMVSIESAVKMLNFKLESWQHFNKSEDKIALHAHIN
jgi:hypothetical protein